MSEMVIRLQIDPETNKKNIVVTLHSDEDALPMEHEEQHRELVDKLVEGGLLKQGEVGKVVVTREEKEKAPAEPTSSEQPQDERRAEGQGN